MDDFKTGFQRYLIDKTDNLPVKRDYSNFLRFISNEVKKIPGVGFYVYGSSQREDFVPGRSDLDGFFVFDDNFVVDKNKLMKLSEIYNRGLIASNVNIPLQFNVLDKGSLEDGRFVSYSKSYLDLFNCGHMKHFSGENLFSNNFSYNYKHSTLSSISHNLAKVRQGFLSLENLIHSNDFRAVHKLFHSSLNKLSQLPKQVGELIQGEVIEEKNSSLISFLGHFPEYNASVVKEVNSIMYNPEKHTLFGFDLQQDLDFSLNALSEVEKMYVEKFPDARDVEVRD